MGQVLHGSATTTEAIGRAIQHSQESLRALANKCGENFHLRLNHSTARPSASDNG